VGRSVEGFGRGEGETVLTLKKEKSSKEVVWEGLDVGLGR